MERPTKRMHPMTIPIIFGTVKEEVIGEVGWKFRKYHFE